MTIESLILEKFRGFEKSTELVIKPITVLIGRNSSGKSTLLRIIPLLQQSLATPSSAPILWGGELVDLGSIGDVVSHGNKQKELRIGFSVRTPNLYRVMQRRGLLHFYGNEEEAAESDDIKLTYIMKLSEHESRTAFRGFSLQILDQQVDLDWDDAGSVQGISMNGKKLSLGEHSFKATTDRIVPTISRVPTDDEVLSRRAMYPFFYPPFAEQLSSVFHGKTARDKKNLIMNRVGYRPYALMKDHLVRLPHIVERKLARSVTDNISDLSLINHLPTILNHLHIEATSCFANSAYIGPARASTERFDRLQELAVNRLTSEGENTAMYLHSLTQKETDSFNELMWIASGHLVHIESSGPSHVSILVSEEGSNTRENVADVGFGFSQIIPVVAQLHAVSERRIQLERGGVDQAIYAVEQPELHLHPAMQGRLADLFVAAAQPPKPDEYPVRVLVETHSESMIGRLGILVASGKVPREAVSIVFVEKDQDAATCSVRAMDFDEAGLIRDWPFGFFSAQS